MLEKKSTSSGAVAVTAITAVVAGVIGYFVGRRNHAERTAAAENARAVAAADREASLAAQTRHIEEAIVAQAKAQAQQRADAEKLAAMTSVQRAAFEDERLYDANAKREDWEARTRIELARQKTQALVDVESRKAAAQEEMLHEARKMRRETQSLRDDRYWDSHDRVWRVY